jgi:hypothetical protein
MVAACLSALFVEVLDVPHDPMAADPDRIEAPSAPGRFRIAKAASNVGKFYTSAGDRDAT